MDQAAELCKATLVVQSQSCLTLCHPWTAARQPSLSFTISQSLLKLMSSESVMPSNHLVLCCPLFLLPSIFPSIRVFSNELALCIRWPQYWSFSFSIRLSNKYSELTSFKIDWFDLLAVQGTFKSLLQHHRSKASILWHYAFFMVQLSHPYITPGKTIALTIQTFVGKVFKLKIKDTSLLSVSLSPTSAAIPPWNMPLRLRECLELEERLCITWKALIISHLFRLS